MACLDENAFVDYFALKLSPADAGELFKHVDTCAACAELFLQTAALHTTMGAEAQATAPAASATLGRYSVEKMLGMGGMGVVYAAHDPQLDRRVAIKLLRPESHAPAETLRLRLMREAQAMAKLSHPNVIHVHEVSSVGDQVFVVMELIDGMTLSAWLRKEKRGWREILQAFLAAGAGVEAAHRVGIIHRDFKPDNVLVANDGRICVTDFGLARLAGESESPADPAAPVSPLQMSMTRSGVLVGTPAYMAPEQLRGEAADARSDVFSFCAALYQALFGALPYTGKTVAELRAAVDKGPPEPPGGAVPRWLRRVVTRGLLPSADARPRTFSELLTALRADPAPRRRRLLVGAAVVGAVALAAGIGHERARSCDGAGSELVGVWDAPRKASLRDTFVKGGRPEATAVWASLEKILDDYTQTWRAARTRACEATRVRREQSELMGELQTQCLHDRVVELRALTDVLADDPERLAHAQGAPRALSAVSDCEDGEALRARTRRPTDAAMRAQVDALFADVAKARALYYGEGLRDALALSTKVAEAPAAAAFPPLEAQALTVRGMSLVVLQRLDEADTVLKKAAQLGLASREERATFQSWMALAFAAAMRHQLDAALEWMRLAEALGGRFADRRLELKRLHTLAEVYRLNNRFVEQADAARRALALAERLDPPDEFELGISLYDVGTALTMQGKFEEALQMERRAVAVLQRHPDAYLRDLDRAITAIGVIVAQLHRWSEAEEAARKGLELDQRIYPADHPMQAYSLVNQAYALWGLGRFDDADAALARAEKLIEPHKDVLGDLVVQLPAIRGLDAAGRGQDAAGTALLEKALLQRDFTGSSRAIVELTLARIERRHGKEKQALAHARAAKTDAEGDGLRDEILLADIAAFLGV